jgi:hypothetical protein
MKYSPSALIGVLSKSQGSTTASHNRFGAYFRGRIIPVNPNTTKQAAQRAIIQSASAGWRALTDVQRAGWAALGASMTRQDSLGNSYTLTGLQAYTSNYRNTKTIGTAQLTAAPALVEPTTLTLLTITATAS